MSHHTHVLLSNHKTINEVISWTNDILSERELAYQGCDSFEIEGIIDMETGEYYESGRCLYDDKINNIQKLEIWANCLFGEGKYNELIKLLENNIKNKFFWKAMDICKELDGIVYPVKMGRKWTVKQPFPICDGYLDMYGVTDWCGCTGINTKEPARFAVILDLHS
jgi:hypothetical protein